MGDKIWANSGDSHILEPDDLWAQILPTRQAERMPRSEKVGDDEEIIHVDGTSFRRRLPKTRTKRDVNGMTISELSVRPPGTRDVKLRMKDLDDEGIWAEVVFSSIGLWSNLIEDPDLVRDAARAHNEWLVSEIQGAAPDRLVCAALMPTIRIEDTVAEVAHAASIGLKAVNMPIGLLAGVPDYNEAAWDPFWAACAEAGLVVCFHIGTEGRDQATVVRGPGGAVANYVETGIGGVRIACKLVTSGALDRHQNLKLHVPESGATWVPYLGDRMNEAYRQHGTFVRPTLSRLPKEILYSQVYVSFQHDETAPACMSAMGYENVMWGSDYPHIEGTFGHTQKTLHELFDDVSPRVKERITTGAFRELFPHVSEPPKG